MKGGFKTLYKKEVDGRFLGRKGIFRKLLPMSRVLRLDGSDGCSLQMYLMSLDYALKNG